MHGNSPEFLLLVNAEVDSMGGVIDGGVGIDSKISPRRAAIEKVQAELRQEYDVREERRRELEFLEKGGNPLDFKLGFETSISVQSTSVADQFVNSEAKDSFALTASPCGDSVEESSRPVAPLARETNTADNLLLFDGENDTVEGERNRTQRSRSIIPPSEHVSQLDGCHNVKESEDSGINVNKSQAYARRNRSRSSRDSARSTDLASVADRNRSSATVSRIVSRDAKGNVWVPTMEKERTIKSSCNSKLTKLNGNMVGKAVDCDNPLDRESDAWQAYGLASGSTKVDECEPDVTASKKFRARDQSPPPQVDADKLAKDTTFVKSDDVVEQGRVSFALEQAAPRCMRSATSTKMENVISASQPNRFSTSNVDEIDTSNEGGNSTGPPGSLDPESFCIHVGHSVDGYTSRDQHTALRITVSPVKSNEDVVLGETSTNAASMDVTAINLVKEEIDNKVVEVPSESNDNHTSGLNSNNSVSGVKVEEETGDGRTSIVIEVKSVGNHERIEHNDQHVSNTTNRDSCDLIVDDSNIQKVELCPENRPSTTTDSTDCDPLEGNLSGRDSKDASKLQTFDESQLKIDKKLHEDSILEEARSIEAKRKRIAELSVRHYPLDYRRKSHWDFLLEEMAWLANDFMQERLWKTTAAVQISYMAASNGRLRINKQDLCCKQKQIAHTLTKSIMQFWRSAEELLNNDPSIVLENCKLGLVGSHKVDEHDAIKDRITDTNTEMSGHLEEQNAAKCHWSAVQEYAVRFLKFSRSLNCPILAEAPKTPERSSDLGIVEMLLKERFSEETLFYTVPPGAMEEYRKSVDNYWSQYEKTGVSMHQEEVETSIYGTVEEFGTRENVYEEDERETGAYYLPGALEGSKSSKSAQKKKKHLHKSYSRSYDVGSDLPYGQFMENKPGTHHHSLILGKRPSNNLNVGSIPIKRVRTASRQRVVCAGSAVLMPTKADASSGDTSSYQDDQSTVHGGSHIRKTLEVESTGEFGKQLPFDCTEVSMRPKKKKKAKHLVFKNSTNSTENGAFVSGKGPAYEQRWQLNSMVQTEQRDYSRKRLESQAFESNGNSGVFGQHAPKRPKISKHLQDTSESITPVTGSVPSPVASQMSNMSNPNKFMKMIGGRDRGRKKTSKVPAGQSGSGNQWSLFEDQALVVLVHDMGPNWELVSDAISSTLQFKCIFKNPKECKERHKVLMDRSAGDGADSAEDSGSSQPYPSTLPGIPKGSARQLFQRLQGPMEEDTLKHHFEKIISVGKKQHSRKNDNQALKQITAVHNSHAAALNQVCPNNMNGVILTPLDLCDTTTSSSDAVSLGYQGPHSSGLAISNQSPTPPALPNSGANSLLQGSSAMVLENSLSSPSAGLNTSSRDGQRYGVPRPSSLPNNENQKVQQYNQMLPGKNIQHSSVSAPVSLPADRGVRMLPGGNGMGMMSGMSRGMPMPRPGFQGINSPAMLNMVSSGSMLPSSGVGMPNPLNLHNGAVSGQANSMMRSREALHMMRSPDEQRQMTMQELQMQATQGNNQCIPPFNGLSTGYSNQTGSPPVQTFPVQNQQQHQMSPQHSHVLNNPHHSHLQGSNHAANPQQQAYMLRMAKPQQRQLHQRIMHQPNQQQLPFASSNATMPHVQPPSQHPISSSLQNSSQIQQQASSQPVSLASSNAQHSLTSSSVPMNPLASQSQQKQNHMPSHGHGRNSQGAGSNLPNQMSKQRQRQQQQHQQPGRNHPQQRQHLQSQQQAKLMKGIGRGNMIMHQNVPIDSSHVNGVSVASGNQVAEKGEQVMHLMQGQGLFSGSSSNPVPPGKPLVAPQPSNQGSSQQKLFTRSPPPSSKQAVQMPSLADNSQGAVPPISSGHSLLASQQPVVPLAMSPSQQQQQPLVRQVGHSQQSVHRMTQQNRQASSDSSFQSCVDEVQVNQQPINNTFHIATSMALPHCVPESTSVVPVSSGNSPSQWKAREPLYDLGASNATSHLASIGNPSLQSSSGAESGALPIQGVCQRQSSGSTPIHSHNVQTQWQPHSQQHKQPPPQQSSPPSTQPLSQQPKLQTQQQPQPNLQSMQGGSYAAPTNSGPG